VPGDELDITKPSSESSSSSSDADSPARVLLDSPPASAGVSSGLIQKVVFLVVIVGVIVAYVRARNGNESNRARYPV
jgi:hypothetical protein